MTTGEALGAKAVIETRTPMIYLHFTLQPGGRVVQQVPAEFNAFAFVVAGDGIFGRPAAKAMRFEMAMFAPGGDQVEMASPVDAAGPLSVLLIAGRPLNEPIVRYAPL